MCFMVEPELLPGLLEYDIYWSVPNEMQGRLV